MKTQIPEICPMAQKLIYICLAIILAFTICLCFFAQMLSPFMRAELLQSILASVAVSLGGGLLFDIEMRNIDKS